MKPNLLAPKKLARFRTCCKKVADQLDRTKRALLWQFAAHRTAHQHLVRLALNEAEALAFQTGYPHLIFPQLALEKVQALSEWHQKQHSIRESDSESFAE